MKEPNKFHNYETEKIACKASVTWQNISSCLVLPPEIVMHDTFNVILLTSADIFASSCMTISVGRTEKHTVIGFGELAAVD